MDLPEAALAQPEPQDEFYALHGAYPLRGRPFGIAFVWSNVYQDSAGASALQIAEDSAARFAEVLQVTKCSEAHHGKSGESELTFAQLRCSAWGTKCARGRMCGRNTSWMT